MIVVAALSAAVAALCVGRPRAVRRLRTHGRGGAPALRRRQRTVSSNDVSSNDVSSNAASSNDASSNDAGAGGDWALAIEVLAACLEAGATIAQALAAAASAAPAPIARNLWSVADALSAGSAPDEVWEVAARSGSEVDGLARALRRTTESGARNAVELRRLAARERARRVSAMRRATARASTWIVLPLGTCFLPAFVLIGVVPVLIGAARLLVR